MDLVLGRCHPGTIKEDSNEIFFPRRRRQKTRHRAAVNHPTMSRRQNRWSHSTLPRMANPRDSAIKFNPWESRTTQEKISALFHPGKGTLSAALPPHHMRLNYLRWPASECTRWFGRCCVRRQSHVVCVQAGDSACQIRRTY